MEHEIPESLSRQPAFLMLLLALKSGHQSWLLVLIIFPCLSGRGSKTQQGLSMLDMNFDSSECLILLFGGGTAVTRPPKVFPEKAGDSVHFLLLFSSFLSESAVQGNKL